MTSTTNQTLRAHASGLRLMPGEAANSVTHGMGFVLSVAGTGTMISFVLHGADVWNCVGCFTFLTTMIAVYFASTCSHAIAKPRLRSWFRQLDQGVIYLFIAGSYTPWILSYFRSGFGMAVLTAIWCAALAGFFSKVFLRHRFNHSCLALYVLLGWLPILTMHNVFEFVPSGAWTWLFIGGACYMSGTVFWKLDKKQYHFHAIWHVLVLLGSTCHFVAVLWYVAP